MIVDPWGEVLGVHPAGQAVVRARIDPEVIAQVRTRLPALDNRRL